jgi:hypothetical protein
MTATATAPAASPVEYVLGLPVEAQEDVFLALVEKVLKVCEGEGKIPLRTSDGRSLGYLTPPQIEAEQTRAFFAGMTPELRQRMTEPVGPIDWDDCLTDEELAAITRGEYQSRPPRSPAPLRETPPVVDPGRGIGR